MNHDQKQREAKLRRKSGVSPEHLERMRTHNEDQQDWKAKCRSCGEKLEGSIEELRGHVCDTSGT